MHHLNQVFIIFALVANSLCSPIAVFGNAMVLAAIWRQTRLRTPSFVFIGCLATADLLTGFISQPSYIIFLLWEDSRNNYNKKPGAYGIEIVNTVGRYFSCVTVAIIPVMSLERWLHVNRRSLINKRRAFFICIATSIALIPMMALRRLLISDSVEKITHFFYPGILGLITFVSFLISTVIYIKVFKVIRCQQLRVENMNQINSRGYCHQPALNITQYKKSVYTILCIMVSSWLSYLPQVFCSFLSDISANGDEMISAEIFHFGLTLHFFSSAVNPALYFWRVREIRLEVQHTVRKMTCQEVNGENLEEQAQ